MHALHKIHDIQVLRVVLYVHVVHDAHDTRDGRAVHGAVEVHGVHGEELDEYEEEKERPRKKGKVDILEAVRKYYDGTAPLTDRQHLIRLELSKLPLTSISAFFGALRRVASTIEAGEGDEVALHSLQNPSKVSRLVISIACN